MKEDLFGGDFLQRLEYLSLLSRRMFRGRLLAQRRTMKTGGGIEFADHREYLPGDDLRYLDWKIYARHGDKLLKRFQEEEDLHVYLFLDVSLSMAVDESDRRSERTGQQSGDPKLTLAKRLAAAIGYIALADLDRVGVVAYGETVVETLPPVRGKNQIMKLLAFLRPIAGGGQRTDLRTAVGDFLTGRPRPGLAVVISDLFDQDGFRGGIERLRHARFEPHVLQIHTPEEAAPSLIGDVELVDCESGVSKKVTINERKLRQYRELFQSFIAGAKQHCTSAGLPHTVATTDTPFDAVMMAMMRSSAVAG